jgi:hypothetical protein
LSILPIDFSSLVQAVVQVVIEPHTYYNQSTLVVKISYRHTFLYIHSHHTTPTLLPCQPLPLRPL